MIQTEPNKLTKEEKNSPNKIHRGDNEGKGEHRGDNEAQGEHGGDNEAQEDAIRQTHRRGKA